MGQNSANFSTQSFMELCVWELGEDNADPSQILSLPLIIPLTLPLTIPLTISLTIQLTLPLTLPIPSVISFNCWWTIHMCGVRLSNWNENRYKRVWKGSCFYYIEGLNKLDTIQTQAVYIICDDRPFKWKCPDF